MARAGDVIEIPRTGERFVFRKTAAETNEDLLEMDFFVRGSGFAPRYHIHERVAERFEVVSGTLKLRVNGKEITLGPGESAVAEGGSKHTFWVEGDEMTHFVAEIRPALDMATLFETVFGLYRDGKTNKRGHENPLQGALLAHEHAAFLAGPPIALQRPVIAALAAIAKLLGYRARYEKYSGGAARVDITQTR